MTTELMAGNAVAEALRSHPFLAGLALAGELDLAGVVASVERLEAVNDALDRLRRATAYGRPRPSTADG